MKMGFSLKGNLVDIQKKRICFAEVIIEDRKILSVTELNAAPETSAGFL
mgnify:CR=1 FL=1